MRVGFTYDLRGDYLKAGFSDEKAAEFDSPDTINAIEDALCAHGFTVDRVGNIQALTRRLAAGERWDVVFNIAEGAWGSAREAQIPALLDAFRIPYTFSGPAVLALTLDKALTKQALAAEDIPTTPFAVLRSVEDAARLTLPYPLFVKPLAEGTGKGISSASRVINAKECAAQVGTLLTRFDQPVLAEPYLPGREFTVGILGSDREARVIGVLEIRLREGAEPFAYSYANKHDCLTLVEYVLAEDAEARKAADIALAAWRALGCLDAGRVDLRSDAQGNPQFMEVNPLAGLNPEVGDLVILARKKGVTHAWLIGEIMRFCLARHGMPWPQIKRRA